MSIQLSHTTAQHSAGISVAKKALDTTEVQAAGLIEMLNTAVPSFGHTLDVRV